MKKLNIFKEYKKCFCLLGYVGFSLCGMLKDLIPAENSPNFK